MAITKLEEILLETLSFYSPMSMEQLLIDMDADKIFEARELTLEDLKGTLNSLEKKKLLKSEGEDNAQTWLRLLPRRPWYKRIF